VCAGEKKVPQAVPVADSIDGVRDFDGPVVRPARVSPTFELTLLMVDGEGGGGKILSCASAKRRRSFHPAAAPVVTRETGKDRKTSEPPTAGAAS